MADLSNNSALGVVVETTSGTFSAPNTTTDLLQVANLKVAVNGITVAVNEYTGSIHKPGDVVLGKTLDLTFDLYLRGPGGTTPPAAGVWPVGRILRAASFAEVVTATAIPAAAEALGAGSTAGTAPASGAAGVPANAVLGTTAASTVDLYTGMLLWLQSKGATLNRKSLAFIRDYQAAKTAALAEVFGSAPTGNYQIPKQLGYQLAPSGAVPTLSTSVWHGSRRFDGVGMAVSSFKITLPVAGRSNTALPVLQVTLSGDLQADADQASPVITPGLAIPPFRDGELWVNGAALGGASFDVNFNATVAYPPNPNKANGNDAAQMASTKRTAALTLNQVCQVGHRLRLSGGFADADFDRGVVGHGVGQLVRGHRDRWPAELSLAGCQRGVRCHERGHLHRRGQQGHLDFDPVLPVMIA